MLVEVFACAYSQEETARHHRGSRRRCLRNDGRMDAHRWTRNARSEAKFSRCGRDCANDAPDKWTLPLFSSPGMIVIRDQGEGKSGLLSPLGKLHEINRPEFFAGQ